MSRSVALDSASAADAAQGVGPLARILLAAAAISFLAGVAVLTLLAGLGEANQVPSLVPVPPAQAAVPVVAAGNTTVPDAAAVFAGREVSVEEPAPTF